MGVSGFGEGGEGVEDLKKEAVRVWFGGERGVSDTQLLYGSFLKASWMHSTAEGMS